MLNRNDVKSEQLLREYVRNSLLTEEGDDAYGTGIIYGSGQDLIDAFVTPFTDVFKTALGKTKELTRKTRTLLDVSLGVVLTTFIPVLGRNYADTFDKEKEDIQKIRGEYKDVYDRTSAALGSGDAKFLAFMAAPAITLSALAASKGPKITKTLLSSATGGKSDEIYDAAKQRMIDLGRWSIGDSGNKKSGKESRSPSDAFESQIIGEKDEVKKGSGDMTPAKLLANKKFIAKALDNPETQRMSQEATAIYQKTLSEILSQAETIMKKSRTVEDVEKAMGKKLDTDTKNKIAEIKKLPPEEKKKAEEMLIQGLRKAMKDFYVKSLTATVDEVTKAGIPSENKFVKDYMEVISKIKAM